MTGTARSEKVREIMLYIKDNRLDEQEHITKFLFPIDMRQRLGSISNIGYLKKVGRMEQNRISSTIFKLTESGHRYIKFLERTREVEA